MDFLAYQVREQVSEFTPLPYLKNLPINIHYFKYPRPEEWVGEAPSFLPVQKSMQGVLQTALEKGRIKDFLLEKATTTSPKPWIWNSEMWTPLDRIDDVSKYTYIECRFLEWIVSRI